jgi:uncharacterized membrane protein
MTLITITRFVALLSTGLLAGIFMGNRLGTSFALPKLPVPSFIQFQQAVHIKYVRFMPALQIAAILSSLAWLFLLGSSSSRPEFALLAVTAAGSVVVFAITLLVNVPINKKLMTWSASAPPANVSELWKPWEKGNTVRTILAAGVFVLELSALILASPAKP